jgi:hypothetical protein
VKRISMNKFCTTCGKALQESSVFCTSCGTRAASAAAATPLGPSVAASPAASQTSASEPKPNDTDPARRKRWPKVVGCVVLFLLGVLIGWWLATKGPQCSPPPKLTPGDGTPMGSGGAGSAGGSPQKLGKGGGGAGGGGLSADGGSTKPGGSGRGGPTDADGDLSGGGGSGGGGADDSAKGDSPTGDTQLGDRVIKLAAGQPLAGAPDQEGPLAKDPANKSMMAPDFTYDKTGLPRYPNSVQKVASAQAFDKGGSGAFGSSVAIATGDDFDKVVAWYQSRMPWGWKSQTVGDFAGMAAKFRALVPGSSDTPPEPDPAGGDKIQLSIFIPPAGATGNPGIMITKKGDQPVLVLMKAHLADPDLAGKAPGSG